MIFEDCISDHNACRERLGMGLLIARYLQTHENKKFYDAIIKYITFIKREIYDSNTGYVYNTVGKDESQVRLYNAPWVSMLFTEMYHLTGDREYLKEVAKLFEIYYSIGGNKFYPNGISILKTANAFKSAGMEDDYKKMYSMFECHVSNMVANGTSYPKHEVNYEQTIVSPAEECMRNCLCLFTDDGRGSAAYMYPYRINDVYGKLYDDWANDQDFALYFALETGLLK